MTAHHPLDRPVWSALTTRQAPLAEGDGRALRFQAAYGLFAAMGDGSAASLAALPGLIAPGGGVALVEAQAPPEVPGTEIASRAGIWQMVCEALTPDERSADFEIVDLTDDDAPAMLALATLTEPGPFFERTHRLGQFVGVKADGKLIAMAGERMKPDGFTEVSGVCTDPGHRGKGYAGALMRVVAARVAARGETAFLHAYAHNKGAIALYESLGFKLRAELTMTMLRKA